MRAVVLSIGAELLEGFITDTNATFLAQELAALGVELVGVRQVGDRLVDIVRELERGWQDAELIITTGGIGPTDDDLTREAIADLLGETPAIDESMLAIISAFFRSRGITMPEQNTKQAWLIPSAEALPNPMGTAPGWFVRHQGRSIVTMPGVPREMRRMWAEQAVPRLAPSLGDRVYVSRTLKTNGIGESAAEKEIAAIIHRGEPIVATYAKDDGVHVRIVAGAPELGPAEEAVARTVAEVSAILGPYIYGELGVSLGAAILEPLVRTGATLALSELGSGGRLSELLVEEPSAERRLLASVVQPWEQATAPGESAAALAAREAAKIRERFGADFGYAIAVRMEPGETPDVTRGEVALCLAGPGAPVERGHRVNAIPAEVRRRAGLWAAEFLWRALHEQVGAAAG
ncbi:MAG TPA: molybdopterin-binding protein [Thermomicrobiaceae bacterium]|nr:molybdopterin-binding protein [Thermomicrobiaceae bacterium]